MLLEKKLAPNRCFDMEVNIEGNPTLFKFFLRYPYSCAHIFKTSKWVATILTWNSSKLILSYPLITSNWTKFCFKINFLAW